MAESDPADVSSNESLPPGLARKLIEHPSVWGEAYLVNRDGSPREYRWYQVEDLECPAKRIAHMDGRSVGKTTDLSTLILHYGAMGKGGSALVAAPYQGHLDTIREEIEFQLNASERLRACLAAGPKGRPRIRRKPYYQIEFAGGGIVYFRPAGVEGEAFRSLHVDFLLVDESAWLPEAAWTALRQCLNPGGVLRVYSTPNGLRDRAYYRITQDRKWTVFRWPSWIVPDWNAELRKELVDFYGGENTAGWKHEVAGEHGMPTYGAFNMEHVLRAVTDLPGYRRVILRGDSFSDCATERDVRERLEILLALPGGHGRYWLGGDLGYTSDPTELLLLEEEDDGALSLVVRVHAEHVAYPVLAELIALIDRIYNPVGLGIDRGGNGAAVEQNLLRLDTFQDNGFGGRLSGYDFGGTIAMGEDDSGREIRKRTKEHMTALITKLLHARKLRLPAQDGEIGDQLCGHSYVLGNRGVVYSKGNDHIVDALRCAVLRRSQAVDPQYGTNVIYVDVTPIATDPIFW